GVMTVGVLAHAGCADLSSRADNQKMSALLAPQVVCVSNRLNQISSRLHRNEASARGASARAESLSTRRHQNNSALAARTNALLLSAKLPAAGAIRLKSIILSIF